MTDIAREIPFRGGAFEARPRAFAAPATLIVAVAFWEFAVRSGWVDALFLPPPSSVASALREMAADGTLALHLGDSLGRLGVGWTMGTIAGIAAGCCIAIWSWPRAAGIPAISALFPIPKIALLPLFILWLGIGEAPKYATIALGVFFPTAIATYSAIDSVPRNLVLMARSFGVSRSAIVARVLLPGALPGVLAGFRITASIGLILLTAAEMIGAQYGIGAMVLASGQLMQTDRLIAGVVLLSMLGLAIGWLLGAIEKRLLAWR
jgi:taurine transport system permease protein